MSALVHIANVLYLVSYWVKDMRTLRLLTIAGIILLIPYYISQREPLYAAALWNVVFLGFNLYRLRSPSTNGCKVSSEV